ncbi:hypothetical protein GUJ93_ZPchr0002g23957 [Zizania palustris]|uniref:sucrose synthase n=1 Tax=Zizania palustris TaxID=103762 RepID=A0A8J5VU71_ZIZPA|nr:hypothetical protein GUJ93_ZPchr0002g23957 [Zizania palustris]
MWCHTAQPHPVHFTADWIHNRSSHRRQIRPPHHRRRPLHSTDLHRHRGRVSCHCEPPAHATPSTRVDYATSVAPLASRREGWGRLRHGAVGRGDAAACGFLQCIAALHELLLSDIDAALEAKTHDVVALGCHVRYRTLEKLLKAGWKSAATLQNIQRFSWFGFRRSGSSVMAHNQTVLYGFIGGTEELLENKTLEIIDFAQIAETLIQYNCRTKVDDVPISLNGYLWNPLVETTVGIDTLCKVLGLPDTGGQIVHILDQVRAMEEELFQGIKQQERYDQDASAKFLDILEGKSDLIIGSYTDSNLVASLVSSRLGVTQRKIAHILDKKKYKDSDVMWREMDQKYHFSCQFSADVIAMNTCDFIITSTYQKIVGSKDKLEKYENHYAFTMPELFHLTIRINVFGPRFNTVMPDADQSIYFPFTQKRNFERLCKVMKEVLGDKIEKVIVFDRVVNSPCCLFTGKYD